MNRYDFSRFRVQEPETPLQQSGGAKRFIDLALFYLLKRCPTCKGRGADAWIESGRRVCACCLAPLP